MSRWRPFLGPIAPPEPMGKLIDGGRVDFVQCPVPASWPSGTAIPFGFRRKGLRHGGISDGCQQDRAN
jgi:hypothetical protein